MKKLRSVGFFKELRHGDPSGDSLKEQVNRSNYDTQRMSRYLDAGVLCVASPGPVFDVLQQGGPPVASGGVKTDGEWAWPTDLPHYARVYGVGLPAEFVAHCEARGWTIPGDIDVRQLSR